MTDLKQAAQQALEAMETNQYTVAELAPHKVVMKFNDAITALREALKQPEQEPTPWRDMIVVTLVREGINKHKARELADHFAAQPEPVACRFCHSEKGCWTWQCYSCGEIDDVQQPTPPAAQRPWQGLTEDDRFEIAAAQHGWEDLLIAAEAKLKERNI